MKTEEKIGLYLTEHTDSAVKMPTTKAQKIIDRVLGSLSDDDISFAEGLEASQTKAVHGMNVKLADEMLYHMLQDKDFRTGYEQMDEEGQAHVWLLLYYMEIIRTYQNEEFVKTFR